MAEIENELDVAPINIGNINDGAVIEGFNICLQRVLENIADINTPATSNREIVLKFIFKPRADRCEIETEFHPTVKLAAIEPHKSKVFMGKTDGGVRIALDSDPRQMPLWSAPKPKEVPVISFGTGGNK